MKKTNLNVTSIIMIMEYNGSITSSLDNIEAGDKIACFLMLMMLVINVVAL